MLHQNKSAGARGRFEIDYNTMYLKTMLGKLQNKRVENCANWFPKQPQCEAKYLKFLKHWGFHKQAWPAFNYAHVCKMMTHLCFYWLYTGGLNQSYFFFIFTAWDHIEHQPICHDRWLNQKLKSFTWGIIWFLIFPIWITWFVLQILYKS